MNAAAQSGKSKMANGNGGILSTRNWLTIIGMGGTVLCAVFYFALDHANDAVREAALHTAQAMLAHENVDMHPGARRELDQFYETFREFRASISEISDTQIRIETTLKRMGDK